MTDPRFDLGLYALPEAARLVRVPRRTLENWVKGYRYPAGGGVAKAKAVIIPTGDGSRSALSFVNLMEALTLAGFRQRDFGEGVWWRRVWFGRVTEIPLMPPPRSPHVHFPHGKSATFVE